MPSREGTVPVAWTEGDEPSSVGRVLVVGGGLIGLGWTIVFARAGIETRVYDSNPRQFDLLRGRLAQALDSMARAGWLKADEGRGVTQRVAYFEDLEPATDGGVQYVQESTPEDRTTKQAVFEELDRILPAGVVIGSSSSTIPMTEIAVRTSHPERCVVVHPTNPPHIVPLVEIVPGERTSTHTVAFALRLMTSVGQSPIVCRKEIDGFVLNRLQFALEREAFYLAREGIASVADIDRCVSEGLGLRWALLGPFMVEETNGADIRDDLTRFGPPINDLIAGVCRPLGPLRPSDIDAAEAGVGELMAGRTHDDMLAYRDRLVLQIRALKAQAGV